MWDTCLQSCSCLLMCLVHDLRRTQQTAWEQGKKCQALSFLVSQASISPQGMFGNKLLKSRRALCEESWILVCAGRFHPFVIEGHFQIARSASVSIQKALFCPPVYWTFVKRWNNLRKGGGGCASRREGWGRKLGVVPTHTSHHQTPVTQLEFPEQI